MVMKLKAFLLREEAEEAVTQSRLVRRARSRAGGDHWRESAPSTSDLLQKQEERCDPQGLSYYRVRPQLFHIQEIQDESF